MSLVSLSVLIATYRRPAGLAALLASLIPQVEGRPEREIVVVNDGTHGPDYEAALAPFGDGVRYHPSQVKLGIAGVRNRSVELANGDYFVFTDDDCVAPAHWLDWIAARLAANPELDVVAGTTSPLDLPHANLIGRVQAHYGLLPRPYPLPNGEQLFVTACLCIRASLLRELGGFNTAPLFAVAGEDSELSARLHRHGARILVDPLWAVEHALSRRLRPELARFHRYGYANALMADEPTAPRAYADLKHRRRDRLLAYLREHYQRNREASRSYPGSRAGQALSLLAVATIQTAYDVGSIAGSREMRRRRSSS